jgi:hypothetical protein
MDIINYSRYALIIQNNHYEIVAGVGAIYIPDDQGIEVKAFATEEEMQTYIQENELISKEEQ